MKSVSNCVPCTGFKIQPQLWVGEWETPSLNTSNTATEGNTGSEIHLQLSFPLEIWEWQVLSSFRWRVYCSAIPGPGWVPRRDLGAVGQCQQLWFGGSGTGASSPSSSSVFSLGKPISKQNLAGCLPFLSHFPNELMGIQSPELGPLSRCQVLWLYKPVLTAPRVFLPHDPRWEREAASAERNTGCGNDRKAPGEAEPVFSPLLSSSPQDNKSCCLKNKQGLVQV